MIAQIRAEMLKQRTTRTAVAVFGTLLALVALAIVVHAVGLPADMLAPRTNQIMVIGVGERLGVLFASLFGAMTVTAEFRYGTIRATLLVAPQRARLLAAKVLVACLIGVIFGLAGSALAVLLGPYLLATRDVTVALTAADYRMLILGAGVAGGLWAVIGVGIGALGRNQVAVLVGLSAWLLFVEGLLADANSSFITVGRFAPGAAATALSGMGGEDLLSPAAAVLVLGAYAAAAWIVGRYALDRRDVP